MLIGSLLRGFDLTIIVWYLLLHLCFSRAYRDVLILD